MYFLTNDTFTILYVFAGYSGSWKSQGKFIDIHPNSFLATAIRVGKSVIVSEITEDIATYTEINVTPMSRVAVASRLIFPSTWERTINLKVGIQMLKT